MYTFRLKYMEYYTCYCSLSTHTHTHTRARAQGKVFNILLYSEERHDTKCNINSCVLYRLIHSSATFTKFSSIKIFMRRDKTITCQENMQTKKGNKKIDRLFIVRHAISNIYLLCIYLLEKNHPTRRKSSLALYIHKCNNALYLNNESEI